MAWKEFRLPVIVLAAALALGSMTAVFAAQPWSAPSSNDLEAQTVDHSDHEHTHRSDTVKEWAPQPTAEHNWRERAAWPAVEGSIPSQAAGLSQVSSVTIEGEPNMTRLMKAGINVTGQGTHANPYVIEDIAISGELELYDTVDYWVIRGNYIDGELRLNWNADKVHVHHNYIHDLRVNENIERDIVATAGLIEDNKIDVVGQIRHFDGVFQNNEVGPLSENAMLDPLVNDLGETVQVPVQEGEVLNIDGFDGGIFTDNTIYGTVDMQVHGHHHASCFGCISHNHGDMNVSENYDHSERYHMVAFSDNKVISDANGPAFRYQDTGHAGDDRTADSEEEEALMGDHQHHTIVVVENNEIRGGPMVVDIFNADDEYHHTQNPGELIVRSNTIEYTLDDQTLRTGFMEQWGPHGLIFSDVKEMTFTVSNNDVLIENGHQESLTQQASSVTGDSMEQAAWTGYRPASVYIQDAKNGSLMLEHNTLSGTHYGVLARTMTESVTWGVLDTTFDNVETEIDYDETVESQPRR